MRNKLENALLGTKAPAITGGYWIKVDRGWRWCTGDVFPSPGGDWTGELVYQSTSTTDKYEEVI